MATERAVIRLLKVVKEAAKEAGFKATVRKQTTGAGERGRKPKSEDLEKLTKQINRAGDNLQRRMKKVFDRGVLEDQKAVFQSEYQQIHARAKVTSKGDFDQKKKALESLAGRIEKAIIKEARETTDLITKTRKRVDKSIDKARRVVSSVEKKGFSIGDNVTFMQNMNEFASKLKDSLKDKTLSLKELQALETPTEILETGANDIEYTIIEHLKARDDVLSKLKVDSISDLPKLSDLKTTKDVMKYITDRAGDLGYAQKYRMLCAVVEMEQSAMQVNFKELRAKLDAKKKEIDDSIGWKSNITSKDMEGFEV